MEDVSTGYCENSRGHEFSCLRASFALRRRLGYYAIKIYGPSILIVMITFIGFWMPIQGLPARVSSLFLFPGVFYDDHSPSRFAFSFLGKFSRISLQTIILVLPLLALITQQTQVNNEIVVSYVVALHLWFIVCTFFIFMALIELAVALLYVQRVADWKDREAREEQQHKLLQEVMRRESVAVPTSSSEGSACDVEQGDSGSRLGASLRPRSFSFAKRASIFTLGGDKEVAGKSTAHLIKILLNHVYGPIDWRQSPQDRNKVDYVSRIMFPSAFLLFVVFYFTSLNS